MKKAIKIHFVAGAAERTYNGIQACGTGMGNRSTRRIGTGNPTKVTCERCLAISKRNLNHQEG